jgi:hypothetical protein
LGTATELVATARNGKEARKIDIVSAIAIHESHPVAESPTWAQPAISGNRLIILAFGFGGKVTVDSSIALESKDEDGNVVGRL